MAIAIDPGEVREYILKQDQDKPESEQTIFLLKTLTAKEDAKLMNIIEYSNENNNATMKWGDRQYSILRFGLSGWKNFKDTKGNEVKCTIISNGRGEKFVADECLDRLHPAIRTELIDAITEMKDLSEDIKKN